ncbi:hypothetical protein [Polyangium aurulentum]|uniref:hypothetical protein n=1 Tax=Polyangium aurulentum TaxID=2567896 RepID=UPI00146BC193|nr:hypothetical protein [Polyangium aurulentum]UQA63009.1 hypothetical protein E8A73_022140 [Polyangium aurulentum]
MKGACLVAAAAILLAASPSGATTKKECAAAYEQTQALRGEGALSAAREQALVCSRDDCPRVIKGDCATWLAEIERSLPTVVFVVRDERGDEIVDVRVTDGGKPLRDKLDGKAVPLDPGAHVLRFEREGSAPIERKVMVHEGDKLVRVEASFKPGGESAEEEPEAPSSSAGSKGGAPVGAYVLGGVGILGLGVAATFGILALGDRADLKDTCAPQCAQGDVDAIRTKLLVADITGGVSIAAIGVATVLLLTAPSGKEPKKDAMPRIDVGPMVGGAFVGVRGAF